MESCETKEAEQLGLELSSLRLDSAHTTLRNEDTEEDEENSYDWLLGTSLFNSVVVVDNLPAIRAGSVEKLEFWVQRNCGKYGDIKKDGVSMPVNPQTQETLGYCFVEYNTRKEAENAQKNLNGHKMEGHILSAYLYDEFDRSMKDLRE
ncbi:Eukaryotic translation initiation factor 3 subunit B [Morella rubra]|uniref:Eukaryotic translation initiation factor 3 subunit B n=1 Tax=Morella rubra TaxID=262757 RepID=A0A6A1W313_9ROSI|nr:Eukaryotic translation initiation factor 3 subunit B [Morella rubra]